MDFSQAVILAGGLGTRLRERLRGAPKPLVEVCGVPLLERQVSELKKYGFTKIVVLVEYRAEKIEDFFALNNDFGLDVKVVRDGEKTGTGGALFGARELLEEFFLLVYGDTLFNVDLHKFCGSFRTMSPSAALLFLHPNDHPSDSDLVELDDENWVKKIHPYPHQEKPYLSNLVNAALGLFRKDVLFSHVMEELSFDITRDFLPRLIDLGYTVGGYNSPEYIKDIGTPERLDRAEFALQTGLVNRACLSEKQKIVFFDRDGTLNKAFPEYINEPSVLDVYPSSGQAIRALQLEEWRIVLATNQPVIARGEATFSDVKEVNAKLENKISQDKAFFDRIFVCPHHPHSGFVGEVAALKILCDCRKPSAGLVKMGLAQLNGDPAKSWFVGDSTSDIGAAKNAGVSSITLRTGNAGLDDKYPYYPEIILDNVAAASQFILSDSIKITTKVSYLMSVFGTKKHWFLAGASKVGKTTIAHVIKKEALNLGLNCQVIELDRWLLGFSGRAENTDVLGKYDIAAICTTFYKINEKMLSFSQLQSVHLPIYNRKYRKKSHLEEEMAFDPETIFIWEGIPAYEISKMLGVEQSTVLVTASDESVQERLLSEYKSRGALISDSNDFLNGTMAESEIVDALHVPISPFFSIKN
jgi:histidinol-phosphate phosphatase family protein